MKKSKISKERKVWITLTVMFTLLVALLWIALFTIAATGKIFNTVVGSFALGVGSVLGAGGLYDGHVYLKRYEASLSQNTTTQ